ncbi:murein hydrolase activator EnvC family protein [Rubricoccus marinus]|uniref:M23ase beta-sheet core domain-containing protein n=1 Tax=Rubricoccus marinus TaxID=716817 RepID=A0A259U080_9BACT|nr:peptidoglycan DD-metalloendopeptidase family protein [Rubricoccus marinus]OZC03248.1 hypothetical protein BSZ36_09830 [Rubricoccus marinus]
MRPLCLSILALLSFGLASGALAQNRAANEQRLREIRGQIASVEREVSQARSVETDALRAVERLGTEIALREELVTGYQNEVAKTRRETEALQRSIQRLDSEIESAQEAYRTRALHAYKHGRRSPLALILASGSINQMLARARYLQQFAGRRRHQVERIGEKTSQLRERERAVVTSLESTKRLLAASQGEQRELDLKKRDHQALIVDARQRRGELERQLRQRRADAGALTQLVADLRAEEQRKEQERLRAEAAAREAARREAERVAEARRAAEAQRRADELSRRAMLEDERRTAPEPRNNTRPAPPVATPAPAPEAPVASAPTAAPESRMERLTGSFSRNRGSLPWPADGTITGAFGNRKDPVSGTTINSVGVDISTQPGAAARAVFEGTVERVGTMATFGTFVMVSHGDYTTVYGNLSQVVVSGGQQVRAGQALGRAGTGEDRRGASLFFAVFQGSGTPLNPTGWLRGR